MKFERIHENIDCDCVEGAAQDLQNVYARKINKPNVLDTDLKSHWEKGSRNSGDCRQICGLKGLSMNIWNKDSRDKAIEKYLTTFKITTKSKNSIYLFKFKKNAGVIVHTPSSGNPYHYDFYKSDNFSIDMLEEVDVIELREFLEN